MARTLQSLINATQGRGTVEGRPGEPSPFGRAPVYQAPTGPGMPLGTPQLSQGALQGGGPSPFDAMGNFNQPRQASSPIFDQRNGPLRMSSPSPFDAYGGAFGGVNQNDLYRKDNIPERGPNGMMSPAPNLDFNAMAGSQNSGQGAALRADAPWRGVFADQWLSATPDEYRRLATAGNRKDPRTGRPMSETNLFGAAPRDAGGELISPQEYNSDTDVSTGFGPGQDPVSGEYTGVDADGDRNSGSGIDDYAEYSDDELQPMYDYYAENPPESPGDREAYEALMAEKAHRAKHYGPNLTPKSKPKKGK